MKVTEKLFKATEKIWDKYYRHPFVEGIRDGNLDKEKFRYYIIQDYLYLIDYARVFALGAAKSPDVDTMKIFAHECASILDEEMSIHDGYMGSLGITEEELLMPMAEENASYTAYMLRVAYEYGVAANCASILACAYSYEVLAKRMMADRPECVDDPLFGEWIRGYGSEEYAAGNRELIRLTNDLTEGIGDEEYRRLEEIFVACSRFEKGFWDMAWNYE
jgi:thiaminase/transcriptional activator TenA